MGRRHNEPDLYFREEAGVWYTVFYDHLGKRHRRSTHQAIRAEAIKDARRIQDEFRAQKAPSTTATMLSSALAQFLARTERSGRATETKGYYIKKGKVLIRVFGADTDVNSLVAADTESYVDARLREGVSRVTIRKELNLLVWSLDHLRKHKKYVGEARDLIPDGLDGSYVPRERRLTHPEYRLLRTALPEERRHYLDAFVGLGVRDSELYAIRPSDVSDDGSVVHVPGTKTKAAKRSIQVTPYLQAVMRERAKLMRGNPSLFPRWHSVRRDLHLACKHAGIPPVSPNDLRRTFASLLAEAGVAEMQIAQMMGHTTSKMIRLVYAKIGSAAQASAASKLPALGDALDMSEEPSEHRTRRRA